MIYTIPLNKLHVVTERGLVVGPTVDLFGFLVQVNTMSAENFHACMVIDISISYI